MEQGAWSVEQERKADEIRAEAKKSFGLGPFALGPSAAPPSVCKALAQFSVFSVQQEEKAEEVRKKSDVCREPEVAAATGTGT